MGTSLFAHLALRFGSHPENLATEALGFILEQSPVARAAVSDVLRTFGASISGDLVYTTQSAGDDNARPDLVARDCTGAEPILIEAKFWAGLTDNQPVAYLRRLGQDGSLVIVAPAMRLPILWSELRRRCVGENLEPIAERIGASGDVSARVAGRLLVLLSWRRLLASIRAAVEGAGESEVAHDIAQLEGLSERMDTDAFLPVSPEELSSAIFRRVVEFGRIVDDATNALVQKSIATSRGFRARGGNGYYGRSLLLHGVGVYLTCDVHKWMKYASTPLWLLVYGPGWDRSDPEVAHRALSAFGVARTGRVFKAFDGFPAVALFVPPGVERDNVIARIVEQVEEIGTVIAPLAVGTPAGPPPEEVAE
jgi:hypothetical protein